VDWLGFFQLATGIHQQSSDTFLFYKKGYWRRRQYTFFNSLAGEKEIPLCLRTHREQFCPGGKAIEFRAT
jgi:hypothetical protein